jgi:4-oxalocrotonate tautomerase
MPYVNVQITKGANRQQKAAIVKDMTDSLVRVLGKNPEHIHIVIQEIEEENWGFGGMLTDDWRKQHQRQDGDPIND